MRHGFSLVELSIVLVILGLLTGGILAGKSLMRASELRAVSTEYQRYLTAAQSFRGKYFELPGDFSKAQSFWGIAHATAATFVAFALRLIDPAARVGMQLAVFVGRELLAARLRNDELA